MALESGTFIDDLVVTNPTITDKRRQGDDHLRLIKSTIKNTFPNIDGAVTPTPAELNFVGGVTSAIQTQLNGKAASSHNHSAAEITSGTLPLGRGGTGGTTAAGARTSLGVGTGDSPQLAGVNLGHASDTTLSRLLAGKPAVEGRPILHLDDAALTSARVFISTAGPSGGVNGDIWLEREA